ncbi:MAG: hypothetical protein ACD_79C01346G0002 [uncultured bacterium]|nr:MAG: hypothetical protein ACD_79C01346G0002 [uncultured bacterium]
MITQSCYTFAASFDCTTAATEVEKIICNDKLLSLKDEQLNEVYKDVVKIPKFKTEQKANQRQWIKIARNSCTDSTCLNNVYGERILELQELLIKGLDQPLCSPKWLSAYDQVCGNLSSKRCIDMGKEVYTTFSNQLKSVTRKLNDPESFQRAQKAWEKYSDLECEALVPLCSEGQSGSCNRPLYDCQLRLACKQLEHLKEVEHEGINGFNGLSE